MSIQEIANFLVEWEYNEDTYLDVTYAALSLFKKDKDCLYAYANSYSPFITHLLEVYEKRQEYSPDKYLIHAGNATVDCGLGYSKDYGIIKENMTVPTSVTEAISSIQQCLKLIRLKGVKYFQYPTEALNGLAEYYAEVYYAYLIKYAKERNTKDIVLNVSAYRDLISNDTVSFIATNWLPNQATGDVYGTVSRIVPCSQIMSEVVDFINKKPETTTEYGIARNTIKVLSIGAKLTERKNQEHVVRLLQVAVDWESAADTEKCAAYMLQVLNDFCAELPFSGDDCCIYRNILKEAREGLPYRYTGLRA